MIKAIRSRQLQAPWRLWMLARLVGATALLAGFPDHALAYIGPGSGITLIGALWAVVVAILLAVGGLFWWPLRALLRKRRRAAAEGQPERPPHS